MSDELKTTKIDVFRRGFVAGWRWHPWLWRGIGVLIGLVIVFAWWRR